MADYFDTAGQQNDQAKAALLQAIATQGSNAKAAFDQQQAQIVQAKQAAIAQALTGAQQRGAPAAMQAEISNTIGSPYDERSQTLGANSATRQAQIAAIGASGDSYITKANAALPALRTRVAESTATKQATVAQQVAAAQAAAIQRQQQAQMAADEHNARMNQIALENQLAQTRASTAADKAAKGPSISSILSDFGGPAAAADTLRSAALQIAHDRVGTAASPTSPGGLRMREEADAPTEQDLLANATGVGAQFGLPDITVQGIMNQRQQQLSRQEQADQRAAFGQQTSAGGVRSDPNYGTAATDLINGAHAGKDRATVLSVLIQTYGPDLARQVMSDYGSAFTSPTGP